MVLELRDKIGLPSATAGAATGTVAVAAAPWRDQVTEALTGLGWTTRQAEDAVARVADGADGADVAGGSPDVSAMLRAALRELGR
jgi:Holliday junction DNA helicase RuvA